MYTMPLTASVSKEGKLLKICLALHVYLLLTARVTFAVEVTNGTLYDKVTLCNFQDKVNAGCLTLTSKMTKNEAAKCALMCKEAADNDRCFGFVVDAEGQCYLMVDSCPDSGTGACTWPLDEQSHAFVLAAEVESSAHVAVEESSTHVAVEESSTHVAVEESSTQIEGNEVYDDPPVQTQSCNSLRTLGHANGFHTVNLTINSVSTMTVCELTDTHTNTYISRNDGSGGYDRTYSDYQTGFHPNDVQFWIGLDNMLHLNHMGLDTVVLSVRFNNGKKSEGTYIGFKVQDSTTGYLLNYTDATITTTYQGGDFNPRQCLPIGIGFSASDKSWDGQETNYATSARAGWWFWAAEGSCNPNGVKYDKKSSSKLHDHVRMDYLALNDNPLAQLFQEVSFFFQETNVD